jgi:hypothetical protein
MATSGSTDWTLTRAQVITGALRKLGVLPSGGTPSTAQTNDGAEALNALIKAFHADGMPIWAIESTTFTVTSGTATYTIGPGQTIDTMYPPLKVLQAFRTPTGETQVPMNLYTRYDFGVLPTDSSVTGDPVNLYYQPTINAGVATGIIKLWPTPDDSTTVITLDYQRPFQDMDATGDNFDFPSYWMQALIYNLAWALAPEYGIPPTDRGLIQKEAIYWKDQALSYGSEEGSITFQPAYNG